MSISTTEDVLRTLNVDDHALSPNLRRDLDTNGYCIIELSEAVWRECANAILPSQKTILDRVRHIGDGWQRMRPSERHVDDHPQFWRQLFVGCPFLGPITLNH